MSSSVPEDESSSIMLLLKHTAEIESLKAQLKEVKLLLLNTSKRKEETECSRCKELQTLLEFTRTKNSAAPQEQRKKLRNIQNCESVLDSTGIQDISTAVNYESVRDSTRIQDISSIEETLCQAGPSRAMNVEHRNTPGKMRRPSKQLNSSQGADFVQISNLTKAFIKENKNNTDSLQRILKKTLQLDTKKKKKKQPVLIGNIVRSMRAFSRKYKSSSTKLLENLAPLKLLEPVHQPTVETINNCETVPGNTEVSTISLSPIKNSETCSVNIPASNNEYIAINNCKTVPGNTEVSTISLSPIKNSETCPVNIPASNDEYIVNPESVNSEVDDFEGEGSTYIPLLPFLDKENMWKNAMPKKLSIKTEPEDPDPRNANTNSNETVIEDLVALPASSFAIESCETLSENPGIPSTSAIESIETVPESPAISSTSSITAKSSETVRENSFNVKKHLDSINNAAVTKNTVDQIRSYIPLNMEDAYPIALPKKVFIKEEPKDLDPENANTKNCETMDGTTTDPSISFPKSGNSETAHKKVNDLLMMNHSKTVFENPAALDLSTGNCETMDYTTMNPSISSLKSGSSETACKNQTGLLHPLTRNNSKTVFENPAISPVSSENITRNPAVSDLSTAELPSRVYSYMNRLPENIYASEMPSGSYTSHVEGANMITPIKRGRPSKPLTFETGGMALLSRRETCKSDSPIKRGRPPKPIIYGTEHTPVKRGRPQKEVL